MNDLDPRSVIPLSEAEIDRIYMEATAATAHTSKPSTQISWETRFIFGIAIVAFLIPGSYVIAGSLVVIAAVAAIHDIYRSRPKPVVVDPNDKLKTVVDFLAAEPIRFLEDLNRRIEADRDRIISSTGQLGEVQEALKAELSQVDDESGRLMIQSRLDVAQLAALKLRQIDDALLSQRIEATLSVKPIVEMRDRFHRLLRIDGSLMQIQAAHQLIEESDASLQANQLNIRLLQALSSRAMSKLTDIDRLVIAQEDARRELMS